VGAAQVNRDRLVSRIDAPAELLHLTVEVEIDLLASDVDGRRGDDDLRREIPAA
jgi:hypothetical protein